MKHLYGAVLVLIILVPEGLANQLVNGNFEAEAILGAGQSPVPPGGGGKKLINNPSEPGYTNAILGIPNWINSFEPAGWRDSGLDRADFDGSGSTQYAFINNWETRLSQVSGWNIAPNDTIQADILVGFSGPLKAGKFQLWAGAPDSGNPDTFPGSAVLLAEVSAATPDWTNYVPNQSLSVGNWHPLQLNYSAPASGPMIGQPLTVSFLTSGGSAGPTLWDNASLTVAPGPTAVPGTSNLWLAGMPNGSVASFDTAPSASPALVASTDIIPGATYSFSTTGTVRNGPDPLTHFGPEGNDSAIIPHEHGVENGIGVVTAPLNSLIGVFLDSLQPDGAPAPTGLNFSDPASRNYLTLAPELKQPFFIGDGLTDLSVLQHIIAPAGATRLFLGTQDGSQWSNNEGSFLVEVARVPNIFEWNDSLGGQFAEGSNWDVGSAPGPTSEIVFNIPGTYEVDFANDESNAILTVRQGNVTFDLAANTHSINPGAAVVGDQAGDTASLRLVGGAAEYNTVFAGKNPGSNGTVTVDGVAAQLTTDAINVGSQGHGTLSIENGGKLSSAIGRVASEAGSQGNATVSGAGSQWSVDRHLTIGGNENSTGGTGALTVSLDGAVTVADLLTVWSAGTVDVSGGGRISIGGGALPAQGTVHVGSGGALSGNGTVIGNVVADGDADSLLGVILPGTSAGVLTIDGNFTQTSGGLLEIEVGGLAAGSEHDKVVVTGSAALAGHLDLPIVNDYVPQPGDSVTILTATNVTGEFAALYIPDLATVNPNVAIELTQSATDVEVHFVSPLSDTELAPDNSVVDWADPDAWNTGVEPGSSHVITLQNPAGVDQTVEVASGDAAVHQLNIVGDSSQTMTLNIKNGLTLSATKELTVGNHGKAKLGAGSQKGNLVSPKVTINKGGTLQGNGDVGQKPCNAHCQLTRKKSCLLTKT